MKEEAQANLNGETSLKAEKNVKAAQDKVAAEPVCLLKQLSKVATARQTDSQKQAEVARPTRLEAKTARDASQRTCRTKLLQLRRPSQT